MPSLYKHKKWPKREKNRKTNLMKGIWQINSNCLANNWQKKIRITLCVSACYTDFHYTNGK